MMKKLKKMSLIKKIIIIYATVVIIPVFLLVSYLSMSQYQRLYLQAVSSKQMALEQLTQSIQISLATVETLSQNLAYRSPIAELISRDNLENFPIWTKRSSNEIIETLKYMLKYQNMGIEDIDIYTNKSELCDQENFYDISLLYGFDFYNNFQEQQKVADFYLLDQELTAKYFKKKNTDVSMDEVLLFVRNFQNEEEESYPEMLVFEIEPKKFLPSIQESRRKDYSIYFTNIKDFYGKPVDPDVISSIQSSAAEHTVNISDVSSGYLYSYIGDYNIAVIDGKEIGKKTYIFLALLRIFVLFGLLIVAQALCLRFLIRYIMNKVNMNINEMDRIVANGFKGQIPVDEFDEFSTITMRYNLLLDKIQALIADMIKKENDKKEAQIKALQYQMSPHFIYNTLNIFSSNAEENGNYKLSEAIAYFGHLLRYNIKNTSMFATVKEEIDNAYSLVQVYSIRCGGNLALELDVPRDLYSVEIIKYLLQPILENSIIHGGGKQKKQTRIRICARRSGAFLIIVISDNGKGIEKEALEMLRKNIVSEEELKNNLPQNKTSVRLSSFIGLRNIYRRLRLIYGKEAMLSVDSRPGEGTVVELRLPVKEFQENG